MGKLLEKIQRKFTFKTFTKTLTFWIIFISIIDVQLSYVLAFIGREQIAQELSTNIVVTILGVSFTYMLRGFFDTYAEKKHDLNIKKLAQELDDKIVDSEMEE